MIFLIILLVLLSIFTYSKANELKDVKANVEQLNIEIEKQNIEIEKQEKTVEKIANHYRREYDNRNIIDMKVRDIYDALKTLNYDYLKNEVATGVSVENNKIVFENGNLYEFGPKNHDYVLRQRYYVLSEDELNFETGYEVIEKNVDSLYVCIMEFVYQNEEWKLSNMYFDL